MDALNAFSWATGRTIINAASTAILGTLTVLLSAGPASTRIVRPARMSASTRSPFGASPR
jgi:hypothetical protein